MAGRDERHARQTAHRRRRFRPLRRTTHRIPICLWLIGATAPAEIEAAHRTGAVLASNHSPLFAPVPEPTLKGAITSLSAAALELLAKN